MHVRRFTVALGLITLGTISYAEHSLREEAALSASAQFNNLPPDYRTAPGNHLASPPAPISTDSFDIGFKISATRLTRPLAFPLPSATSGYPPYGSFLRLREDLPFGFDIGASFGTLPGSDLQLIGAEARYVLLPTNMALPTLGLRASFSNLKSNNWLGTSTRGLDLSLSKGFSLVTPYAGIGSVWTDSDSYEGAGWTNEHFHHEKYFVGANFSAQLLNFAVEADRTGNTISYHAKFGWQW